MKKAIWLIIPLQLVVGYCRAQFYIEPIIGYQLNLRNTAFKQLNTGLQGSYKTAKNYELIFQLQKSWPVTATSNDSAFSLNPAVPVYTNAAKKIKPAAFSIAVGHRIKVAGVNTANTFSLLIFTGFKFEKIDVNYQYDKSNYIILNPDKTQKRNGVYAGLGLEYMHVFSKGRVFTQLNFATAPVGRKINYPSSFQFVVPLSLSIGYSMSLNNNKHEK